MKVPKSQSDIMFLFMVLLSEMMTNHAIFAFTATNRISRLYRHIDNFANSKSTCHGPLITSMASTDTTVTDENGIDEQDQVAKGDSTSNVADKRSTLLSVARDCHDKYGFFLNGLLVSKSTQKQLMDAVVALEEESDGIRRDQVLELLPGDWDLICTLSYDPSTSIPFLDSDFIQNLLPTNNVSPIVALGNRLVTITQRIRCMDEDNNINRVDHVIQYQPPKQLGDLFEGQDKSSWWNSININPLSISQSQIILVHKAEVVSSSKDQESNPNLPKIHLVLQSIVNNVAGTSWNLDPNGSDILGLNLPQLPGIANNDIYDSLGGSFTTTYIDSSIRISRSDTDLFRKDGTNRRQQIRIFQRRMKDDASNTNIAAVGSSQEEESGEEDQDTMEVERPSDVEE